MELLVDADRVELRLERLGQLIDQLDNVQAGGEKAYLDNPELRAAAERWLELAIQICIDLGTQLAVQRGGPIPESYAEVFTILQKQGLVPDHLALSLAAAAGQRNLLAHLYLEIDDKKVFESLSNLDRLRQFGALVENQLD